MPRGGGASAQVWQNAIAFVDKPPGLCFQEARRRLKAASGLKVGAAAFHPSPGVISSPVPASLTQLADCESYSRAATS